VDDGGVDDGVDDDGVNVLASASDEFVTFWTERRVCLLATTSPDGTPHVVAVGATIDRESGLARVIARIRSKKVRNVIAAGEGGARVAVTAHEGRRWSTLQGLGVVYADSERVAEAERRYAQRYHVPRPNPERVVIEIAVDHLLGSVQ
jgi:F420H(2)-dependent biliverdin reductase